MALGPSYILQLPAEKGTFGCSIIVTVHACARPQEDAKRAAYIIGKNRICLLSYCICTNSGKLPAELCLLARCVSCFSVDMQRILS